MKFLRHEEHLVLLDHAEYLTLWEIIKHAEYFLTLGIFGTFSTWMKTNQLYICTYARLSKSECYLHCTFNRKLGTFGTF